MGRRLPHPAKIKHPRLRVRHPTYAYLEQVEEHIMKQRLYWLFKYLFGFGFSVYKKKRGLPYRATTEEVLASLPGGLGNRLLELNLELRDFGLSFPMLKDFLEADSWLRGFLASGGVDYAAVERVRNLGL